MLKCAQLLHAGKQYLCFDFKLSNLVMHKNTVKCIDIIESLYYIDADDRFTHSMDIGYFPRRNLTDNQVKYVNLPPSSSLMLCSIAVALVNMLNIRNLCEQKKIDGLSKLEFDLLKTCFFYKAGDFLSTPESDEETCQSFFGRSQEDFIPNSDPFYY